MEKTININQFEDKIAKNNNPYTRFQLSDGKWISCFDVKEILVLKAKIKRNIVVEVSVNDKGETLRKFIKDNDEAEVVDMTLITNDQKLDAIYEFVLKLKEAFK